MSLKVWLPLNGQFENQGLLGPLAQTATPTYINGKFGKSLASGGCSMTTEQAASVLNNEAVSICFWVYMNADTGINPTDISTTNMLFGNDDKRRFSLFAYPTINDLHCSWENTDESYIIASVDTGVLPSYTWTHVAVTYQNPTIKIYINGKLIRTHTAASNADFSYATQVIYDVTWRYFNDFRIYDHCLSEKEIKEINKGLVLHYPLNGGEGGINLLKNELAYYSTSSGHSYIGSTPVFDTDLMPLNSLIGKTITFTFDYSIEGDKLNTSGSWELMRYGAHLTINYTNSAGVSETTYPCTGSLHDRPTPEGTGHSVQTYTFPSDWQSIEYFGIAVQPQNRPAANNSATWYLKNFKLELGYIDTGYSVNPHTAGTSIEIPDCSGLGNKGIPSSIFTYSTSSPRYDASTCIDELKSIALPNLAYEGIDQGTLSFWVNFNKFKNWSHYFLIADAFNWTGQERDFIIMANNSPVDTETASTNICLACCSYLSTHSMNTNKWYHIALTWDAKSYTIKKYINGSLVSTHDDTTNKRLDIYRAKHGMHYIGNGFANTQYTGDFNLSDVRIYATALPIEDIKELYSTAASLDKEGNMYAYKFKEE